MRAKPDSANLRALFGRHCKAARISSGLTQAQVGAVIGMARQTVAQIELGKANLTLETMARLASAVERDVVSLLTPDTSAL